jgi:hypothetical protein
MIRLIIASQSNKMVLVPLVIQDTVGKSVTSSIQLVKLTLQNVIVLHVGLEVL